MISNSNILSYSIILLCSIIVNNTLQSQTFENLYSTSNDDFVYDAVLINEQEVVFAVNSGDFFYGNYNSKLFKMNYISGDFIDSVEVKLESADYVNNGITHLHLISDTLILVIGNSFHNTNFKYTFFIQHYNTGFELLYDTIIENYEIMPHDYKLHGDSILYLTGMYQPFHQFIEERDIWGKLIRQMGYNFSAHLASSIHRTNTHYHMFLIFDNHHRFVAINLSDLTVDTVLQYPQGFLPRNTINSPVSNFYFVSGRMDRVTFPNPPYVNRNLGYLKVNSSDMSYHLTDFHTDSLNYYSIHSFSINPNYIFFGGTQMLTWPSLPHEFFMFPGPRWLLLYKLTHEGGVVWQKFYKGEVDYMMYKVLATSDDGVLIFSTRYDWNDPVPFQRDVHILKVDYDGNYVVGIDEFNIEPKQILVYPIPVSNEINFAFGLYDNLEISIFDSQGRTVHQKKWQHSAKIDVSQFNPGMYFYTIIGRNGFTESGKFIKL